VTPEHAINLGVSRCAAALWPQHDDSNSILHDNQKKETQQRQQCDTISWTISPAFAAYKGAHDVCCHAHFGQIDSHESKTNVPTPPCPPTPPISSLSSLSSHGSLRQASSSGGSYTKGGRRRAEPRVAGPMKAWMLSVSMVHNHRDIRIELPCIPWRTMEMLLDLP
jgi:hypothetical protein